MKLLIFTICKVWNINGLYKIDLDKGRDCFHTGQTRHRWTKSYEDIIFKAYNMYAYVYIYI